MNADAYLLIFEYYLFFFLALGITIYYFIRVYKKKTLFVSNQQTEYSKKFVEKYKKQSTIVVVVGLSIGISFLLFYGILILPDLPNVLTNNYKTEECIIKTDIKNQAMHCNINNRNIEIIHNTLLEDKTKIKINYFYHVPVGCVEEILN